MVKGVATSIITVAVLMGSLVACGGSEPETTVEETPEEEVAEPLSTADQFELVKGGVVRLEVATCEAGGTGTGFLIDEYHVVTVAHVVDEAQEIIAYVDDEIAIAEVVAIDIDRELALLRTDIPVGSYYFSLGDFDYRTGDEVSVIGFPRALDLTLTVGTISNEEVSFDDLPLVKFMQIDAAANPGNSGGPVLNNYGEVVGILQGGFADSEGLNFAISVDSVDRILSSWVDNTPISFPACGSGSSTTEPVASSESVFHPPAEVRVLVANATDVGGAAGAVREVLISDQGYNGLPPVVATTGEVSDSSFVYYANGYELDARNVGLIIGVDSANVLPMPVVLPVADLSEANVLVLLGSDLFPAEPVASSESVLHPPAEVRVLVANATDVGGAAGAVREVLISEQGYNGLPPVVATTGEVSDSSFVYYANGYELDARNVGLIIGVDSANVLPMPVVLPVADLSEANVLVLLGSDLFPD